MEWVTNCLTKAVQHVTAFTQQVTTFVSHLLVDQSKQTADVIVPNTGNQVELDVSDIEAVVINANQSYAGVSDNTSLVHQTPIGAQATHSFDVENPISLSPIEEVVNNGNIVVRDQTHVGVSDSTSLLHQTPVSAQATSSFYIESPGSFSPNEVAANRNANTRDQPGVNMSATDPMPPQIPIAAQATSTFHIQDPRNLPREVVRNGNAEVRDETRVDIPLLPQTPLAAQATISSHMHAPRHLPQGGEQNSPGVANVVLGVQSQHPGPPTRPNEARDNYIQALMTEGKEVANRVTFISAGGIFSELSGVIGNEEAVLMHENFFKAFMILCYLSLALGLGLHRLIKISPKTPGFVMMVKITIYFAQGSLVYAISFAICLLFPSKVGVGFVLVVPLIPIGLVAILSFAHKEHGSIP